MGKNVETQNTPGSKRHVTVKQSHILPVICSIEP